MSVRVVIDMSKGLRILGTFPEAMIIAKGCQTLRRSHVHVQVDGKLHIVMHHRSAYV